MRMTWSGKNGAAVMIGVLALVAGAQPPEKPEATAGEPLVLHARVREPVANAAGSFVVKEKILSWDPAQTAIIICDMWNQHWCRGATRRVGELAPAMNRAIAAARAKGVLHHPLPQQLHGRLQGPPRAEAGPRRPQGREPARHISASGATRSRPRRKGSTRSTSPTAAATTGRSARRAHPGNRRSPPSRSTTKTRSATRAPRSGTCSRAGESRTSCSWAFIPICACSAGRSACATWPRPARTSSWSAT